MREANWNFVYSLSIAIMPPILFWVILLLFVPPSSAAILPKQETPLNRPYTAKDGKQPYCMEMRAMQKVMVLPDGSKVALTPVFRLQMLVPCS